MKEKEILDFLEKLSESDRQHVLITYNPKEVADDDVEVYFSIKTAEGLLRIIMAQDIAADSMLEVFKEDNPKDYKKLANFLEQQKKEEANDLPNIC